MNSVNTILPIDIAEGKVNGPNGKFSGIVFKEEYLNKFCFALSYYTYDTIQKMSLIRLYYKVGGLNFFMYAPIDFDFQTLLDEYDDIEFKKFIDDKEVI